MSMMMMMNDDDEDEDDDGDGGDDEADDVEQGRFLPRAVSLVRCSTLALCFSSSPSS